MIRIQFLTAPGCLECERAKVIFQEVKKEFSYLKLHIEKINIITAKGLDLAVEHSVLSNPGIIINGKLFSSGTLDKKKFISKILSL